MAELVSDEQMLSLSDDPEEAFVQLERFARTSIEERLEDGGNASKYQQYIRTILAAASVYGVSDLSHWEPPHISDTTWELYLQFLADVDHCTTEMRLLKARRVREYSVVLDAATKVKLRHHLTQIRETVDKLEISLAKKERLYAKISALQSEIERERTRFQAFGALMIEACDDAGEAAKRLEPVVRIVERIGAAIGIAKRTEDAQERLPAPKEQKRIETSKKPARAPKKRGGEFDRPLDDEIPF